MKNKSYRHKQSVVAWIIMAIGLFMLCATLAGLCMQLFGKGKYKPSEWLTQEKQVEVSETASEENSDIAIDLPNNETTATVAHRTSSVMVSAMETRAVDSVPYDKVPYNCRTINVGDDLSGATIYVDFSTVNVDAQMQTSGLYHLRRNNYSGMDFGFCKDSYRDPQNPQSGTYEGYITITLCYTSGDSYKSNPVKSFTLPTDFGTVQSLSGVTGIYVYDPAFVAMYRTSDVNPFGCVTSACFSPLTSSSRDYSGGYLVIKYSNISGKVMQSTSGDVSNMAFVNVGSYDTVSADGGNFVYFKYTGSDYERKYINTSKVIDGYIYFRVDMQSSRLSSGCPSDTFFYVSDHQHKEFFTESLVSGYDFNDGGYLSSPNSYSGGYIAIDVSAIKTFLSSSADCPLLTFGRYNDGFYITGGCLMYYERIGNVDVATLIVSENTSADYIYLLLDIDNLSFKNANAYNMFRYLINETITVTFEYIGGSTTRTILKGGCVRETSLPVAVGNSWYNADGYSLRYIPQSTTFLDVFKVDSFGHQSEFKLYKPYRYSARINIRIGTNEIDGSSTSIDYFAGYTANGELCVIYERTKFGNYLRTMLGDDLDFSKGSVDLILRPKSESSEMPFRKQTFVLLDLMYSSSFVFNNVAYSMVLISTDSADNRFSLEDTTAYFNIRFDSAIVKEKLISIRVTFDGYLRHVRNDNVAFVNEYLIGQYTEYYTGEFFVKFDESLLKKLIDKYESFGTYCEILPYKDESPPDWNEVWTDSYWSKDENGYYFQTFSDNLSFHVTVCQYKISLCLKGYSYSKDFPIFTYPEKDGYYIQLRMQNPIPMTNSEYTEFCKVAKGYRSMSMLEYFDDKYIDPFIQVFSLASYSDISDWGQFGGLCFDNLPSYLLLRSEKDVTSGFDTNVVGIALKIPDSTVKSGKYTMVLDTCSATDLRAKAKEKPNGFLDSVSNGVSNFFGGVFGGLGETVNKILAVAFTVIASIIFLPLLIRLLSLVCSLISIAVRRRKK